MSSDNQKQVNDHFRACVDLSESERREYLDANCPDAEIRSLVEDLLARDAQADSQFLSPPSISPDPDADLTAPHRLAHLLCPICRARIELLGQEPPDEVECPSCSKRFSSRDARIETEGTQPFPGPARFGEFELLETLGTGTFGTVWKAFQPSLDRTVAIKRPRLEKLNASVASQFQREARAAAQLQHPNIVTLFGVEETEHGEPYLISEFIDGVTLSEFIKEPQHSFADTVNWMIELSHAMHHAHQRGVIHRDFKPGNVLIDSQGKLHVTDFGMAKRETGEVTMTVKGQVLGTLHYMSPEQARGDAHEADRRSDVYSLGATMYKLLTGKTPFGGVSTMILHKIQTQEPPPLRKLSPDIPRDLQTICEKAMRKAPGMRYQTAEELAQDLERFRDGRPIHARPVPLVEKSWRLVLRNRAVAALAAAVAVLLTGLMLKPGPPKPFTYDVEFSTDPPGASLQIARVNPRTKKPIRETEIEAGREHIQDLKPGLYWVTAKLPNGDFHEVYRTVPNEEEVLTVKERRKADGLSDVKVDGYAHLSWSLNGGRITVAPIVILPEKQVIADMILVEGGEFTMGDDNSALTPKHKRTVESFYMDPREVTIEQWTSVEGYKRVPPGLYELWPEATPESPVTNIRWDQVVSWAETQGKRLAFEDEWEFAATNRGTTKYPTGDTEIDRTDWGLEPLESDRTALGIVGMNSGVGEWTASSPDFYPGGKRFAQMLPQIPVNRVVRGIVPSVLQESPNPQKFTDSVTARFPYLAATLHRRIGFRAVRSVLSSK